MNRMYTLFVWATVAGALHAASSDANPPNRPRENLSLVQALAMAEHLQPELAVAKAMVDAAEGRARQAGVLPNPELIAGAEQIPLREGGASEKEYIAGIAQTIPVGGRLSKAREAEQLARTGQERALEAKARDIRRRIQSAFATALYQAKAREAETQVLGNAETLLATTRARVEAGDLLREDLARAEMEVARAKVGAQRASSLHQQALVGLASAIGDPGLEVKSLVGDLEAAFEIPALESIVASLDSHPQNAQAQAEARASSARLDAARAERIPDVRVEVLYHRLEASHQDTVDLGLSIPLPIFNRNQGRIREARAEAAAAEARARMTRNELTARGREAHVQLSAALANSRTMKDEVLPRADFVLKAAEARYAAGDIGLAELLPVRRELASVQLGYLESLRDVMHAWAELKALAGPN